jgi:hypothetical protein
MIAFTEIDKKNNENNSEYSLVAHGRDIKRRKIIDPEIGLPLFGNNFLVIRYKFNVIKNKTISEKILNSKKFSPDKKFKIK